MAHFFRVRAFTYFETCFKIHTVIACKNVEGYHLHQRRIPKPVNHKHEHNNQHVTNQLGNHGPSSTLIMTNCLYS